MSGCISLNTLIKNAQPYAVIKSFFVSSIFPDICIKTVYLGSGVVTGTSLFYSEIVDGGVTQRNNYIVTQTIDEVRDLITPPVISPTWKYHAGISGTVTLTGGNKVVKISASATVTTATVTINGGDSITLPAGGVGNILT